MGDGGFFLLVFGTLAALIGLALLVARLHPGSGADLLDWRPTRSAEVEAENELEDLDQMLEAQNARRRRRGAPERTLEEVELTVARELAWQHERAADAEADAEDLRRTLRERRARRDAG
jgi:hypothetical protein